MEILVKSSFSRIAPASFNDKAQLPLGWFVIRHSHIKDRATRRKFHGKWFKIKSENAVVYRILRFSVNLKGSSKGSEIVVDWAGWIDLQGRTDNETPELQLEISPAKWYQIIFLPIKHADAAVRLSGWLGYISIGLGFLSVVLAICLANSSPVVIIR